MRVFILLAVVMVMSDLALGAIGDAGVSSFGDSASMESLLGGSSVSSMYPSDTGYNYPSSTGYNYQTGSEMSGSGLSGSGTYPGSTSSSLTGVQSSTWMQGSGLPQTTGMQNQYQYSGMQYSGTQGSFGTDQTSFDSGYWSGVTSAPETAGPYQDGLAPTNLNLVQPQAESFQQPEGSLDFSTATPPTGLSFGGEASSYGSSSWYYPGSVVSTNKFYVQTSSGLRTVAGCYRGGYLPLWAEISTGGYFYSYEWYPGQTTPSFRGWGWAMQGYRRGWFSADVPGWHVLCYNCGGWSNYIYIYVYPSSYPSSQTYGGVQQTAIPQGAPVPPSINQEGLILPNPSLVPSRQGCYSQGTAGQQNCQGEIYSPNQVFPQVSGCECHSTSCGCNGYYIQVWPNKLTTAAGVRVGEWLPLWSQVGRAGTYWSYEWAPCSSFPHGFYCSPEVNCFGSKTNGWFPTWFYGNNEGWHILAYYCGDWSNYIYIYVWPYR